MTFLATDGPRADPITSLTWGLLALSTAVVAFMALAVVVGVAARRDRRRTVDLNQIPVARGDGGLTWIYVGLSLTVIALFGALLWTMQALASVDSPGAPPRVILEVTGHEWWWEIRYLGATPAETFETANEIHIPVGEPVLVKLYGADVIHSFWIPALTGKTDTIPGRENISWLQADRPGLYRGQCTEYCGLQHAHMAVFVVAEPRANFEAWRAAQTAPSAPSTLTLAGHQVFVDRCGACHTVRGASAGGVLGPDLTHLMSRQTLAAGALANTPDALLGWIANPQAIKPGVQMPATLLDGRDLTRLRAYLMSLR